MVTQRFRQKNRYRVSNLSTLRGLASHEDPLIRETLDSSGFSDRELSRQRGVNWWMKASQVIASGTVAPSCPDGARGQIRVKSRSSVTRIAFSWQKMAPSLHNMRSMLIRFLIDRRVNGTDEVTDSRHDSHRIAD